ncbi:MAG: methylenetetrahydrofolate reductase [Candidatus Rokubacteria bacterium]|nr:methylenetetrahydrofolate reductase [Candidatus Rokubacteria bacterium]
MGAKRSPSRLERRLLEGHIVVTAEINPPRHAGADTVRTQARLLLGAVDAVNLTDCTRGIVRMSSTAAALLVREEGVEPIVQMTCRDRNKIALQSELLGLSALGLHTLLLLTGDDPAQGDHPDAKPVFDLNGTALLAAADRMRREGALLSGRVVAERPSLFLGAAADPEKDLAKPDRMATEEKAAAGADFVQTQPVFDLDRFSRWMELVRAAGLHRQVAILAGVFLLDSARRADFLRTVPGVVLSDTMYQRLASAADERAEGLRLAIELVDGVSSIEGVRGIHLMGVDATEGVRAVVEGSGLARHVTGAR